MFWLFIAIALGLYILADAFFDISKKISSWARPFLRRAWGAVVGVARKRAAPAAPVEPVVAIKANTEAAQTPPNKSIDVLAFIEKRWKALVIIGIGLFCFAALRGCDLNPFASSPDRLRLERDLAEGEAETQETINERDQDIAAIDRNLALMRQQLQQLSQRGRDEIAAAAPDDEAPIDPELVAAFRNSLDRMCVPRADGTRADSCE